MGLANRACSSRPARVWVVTVSWNWKEWSWNLSQNWKHEIAVKKHVIIQKNTPKKYRLFNVFYSVFQLNILQSQLSVSERLVFPAVLFSIEKSFKVTVQAPKTHSIPWTVYLLYESHPRHGKYYVRCRAHRECNTVATGDNRVMHVAFAHRNTNLSD